MENTTRIVDLPENVVVQMPNSMGSNRKDFLNESSTTYTPMNIHPNPYGNTAQPAPIVLPEFQNNARNNYDTRTPEYIPTEQIRLASRDIPMDQSLYQQDEEIQPNFIPKPKLTGDYIKEYESASDKKFQKHEKEKQTAEELDHAMTELQIPVFVALLFFIFNMPFFNTLLYRFLKVFPIFHSDGNLNFYGILFKSSLFGCLFFVIQKAIKFLMVI
jgi:hypothetical protein